MDTELVALMSVLGRTSVASWSISEESNDSVQGAVSLFQDTRIVMIVSK